MAATEAAVFCDSDGVLALGPTRVIDDLIQIGAVGVAQTQMGLILLDPAGTSGPAQRLIFDTATDSYLAGESGAERLIARTTTTPTDSRAIIFNASTLLFEERPASTTTVYVSKNGDDANDGRTPESAVLTIGAAVALAGPLETISVGAGVYSETVTLPELNLYGPGVDLIGTLAIVGGSPAVRLRSIQNNSAGAALSYTGTDTATARLDSLSGTAGSLIENTVAGGRLDVRATRIETTGDVVSASTVGTVNIDANDVIVGASTTILQGGATGTVNLRGCLLSGAFGATLFQTSGIVLNADFTSTTFGPEDLSSDVNAAGVATFALAQNLAPSGLIIENGTQAATVWTAAGYSNVGPGGAELLLPAADGVTSGTAVISAPTVNVVASTLLDLDTGALDIDATGAVTIDATSIALAASTASGVTVDGVLFNDGGLSFDSGTNVIDTYASETFNTTVTSGNSSAPFTFNLTRTGTAISGSISWVALGFNPTSSLVVGAAGQIPVAWRPFTDTNNFVLVGDFNGPTQLGRISVSADGGFTVGIGAAQSNFIGGAGFISWTVSSSAVSWRGA